MKIAIACASEDKDAKVVGNGGRASYYQLYNDKKLIMKVHNFFEIGGGAVGWSPVRMYFTEEKIEIFVATDIGPNMDAALKSKNIRFEKFEGTVKDALKKFAN